MNALNNDELSELYFQVEADSDGVGIEMVRRAFDAGVDAAIKAATDKLLERTAQIAAHRGCCGTEHDPANGKLHGLCVVCGVPWPCEYAGKPPRAEP